MHGIVMGFDGVVVSLECFNVEVFILTGLKLRVAMAVVWLWLWLFCV